MMRDFFPGSTSQPWNPARELFHPDKEKACHQSSGSPPEETRDRRFQFSPASQHLKLSVCGAVRTHQFLLIEFCWVSWTLPGALYWTFPKQWRTLNLITARTALLCICLWQGSCWPAAWQSSHAAPWANLCPPLVLRLGAFKNSPMEQSQAVERLSHLSGTAKNSKHTRPACLSALHCLSHGVVRYIMRATVYVYTALHTYHTYTSYTYLTFRKSKSSWSYSSFKDISYSNLINYQWYASASTTTVVVD